MAFPLLQQKDLSHYLFYREVPVYPSEGLSETQCTSRGILFQHMNHHLSPRIFHFYQIYVLANGISNPLQMLGEDISPLKKPQGMSLQMAAYSFHKYPVGRTSVKWIQFSFYSQLYRKRKRKIRKINGDKQKI